MTAVTWAKMVGGFWAKTIEFSVETNRRLTAMYRHLIGKLPLQAFAQAFAKPLKTYCLFIYRIDIVYQYQIVFWEGFKIEFLQLIRKTD